MQNELASLKGEPASYPAVGRSGLAQTLRPNDNFCGDARVDPNPENYLRAPCKFQYSALNLEIGSKSEPKIYKIQCLNLDIACTAALTFRLSES